MQLEDWLDDLCVRFIINLPPEELESVERICFQVEEAQWFYEDFIRPLDPHLPSLSLRAFSLRIFRHCPLFSQWSAQHHTTAFAEFLAYKQRVPVRGAIMLNEAMDEVVLVKGWKKGANWSFPRGKINKDEDDLDCAVREVFEETGYDIRAAGLVKEPKDMKYIEVTMREQHMRLYVFRGVPKNTHFEPRTRKEISKIEWYKLTDLPTLKRHKNQEGIDDALAVNANKFYMVAPFLSPLKNWIAQQRKNDKRRSSQPAHLAPPTVAEDVVTEDEYGLQTAKLRPELSKVISRGPSDLPEVSLSQSQDTLADPSSHLKKMLNIDARTQSQEHVNPPPLVPQSVDAAKSSALLALLRGNSTVELRASPRTPLEPASIPVDLHSRYPQTSQVSSLLPPTHHTETPPQSTYRQQLSDIKEQAHSHVSQLSTPSTQSGLLPGHDHPTAPSEYYLRLPPRVAPYQRTGDPEFSHQPEQHQQSFAPPASALPKLTTHTRALLDVFKTGPLASQKPADDTVGASSSGIQSHVAAAASKTLQPPSEHPTPAAWQSEQSFSDKPVHTTVLHQPQSDQKANLLNLFRQSSIPSAAPSATNPQTTSEHLPVELAATSTTTNANSKLASKNDLLNLLKREGDITQKQTMKQLPPRIMGEGETSATINSPLNQPQFDSMKKSHKMNPKAGRSPVTSDRTLYDPNQPTPIKILARPDENKRSPARSPAPNKKGVASSSSPKRIPAPKEQARSFQPQILRRPQTAENQATSVPGVSTKPNAATSSTITHTQTASQPRVSPQPRAVEGHRKTLLSLFNEPATTNESPPTPQAVQIPQNVVSPLTGSQAVSPADERSLQGMEPISTRSRVGSLASIASSSVRPPNEKRQTAAGDKAFLLGYLGRIASREG